MYSKPFFLIALLSLGIFTSCKNNSETKAEANKAPLTYNVLSVEPRSVSLYIEYPASLLGVLDIDIRPKIDGYIDHIYIDEGQKVKRDQPLFRIHNPQFTQDVANYKALIESAQAAVDLAELQVNKTKPLVDQDIISNYELKNADLNLAAKKAALAQAKAAYNNALINQGYTHVTSPVNGVVGTIPYRIGSYVNSNTAQPLTTVSDISKVYAYFSINEKQQLAFMSTKENKSFEESIKALPAVQLILSNGELYPNEGNIETFSGKVNTSTGSFNVRAGFANPNQVLHSGNSAKIRIPTHLENVIVIPQYASTELQDKRLAYIVSDSNKVKSVVIKVREVPGGKFYVVEDGLKTGDQIVLEGIGIIKDGTAITPKAVNADSVLAVTTVVEQ